MLLSKVAYVLMKCAFSTKCSVVGGLLTVAGFYLVVYGQGVERKRKSKKLAIEAQKDLEKLSFEDDLKQPLLPPALEEV